MITANVIHRVLHIRAGQSTGTAFTIEHDGRQYLITAAHVVAKQHTPYEIEIFHNGAWKKLELNLTGIAAHADIAVFAAPFLLSPTLPMPASADKVTYGQDVYFLGFPYGISPESKGLNRAYPFPLVKRACLSAIVTENGANVWLLDGLNNPGFSGGPIVFRPIGQSLNGQMKVMGVVSGYRFAEEPVYHQGEVAPVTVRANTGIIIAYDIKHAIEEINKNPNGAYVSTV